MHPELRKIKEVTWNEVFNHWRETEGGDPVWQKIATEVKGWSSWEEWRLYKISDLHFDQHNWELCEIQNPMKTIPSFLIGPYQTWQQFFERKMVHTFSDIIDQQYEWVSENASIIKMVEKFPSPTQFIGLYCEAGDKVIIFEGHHRAAAVALAAKQGKEIDFQESPKIAIAKVDTDDYLELIGLADESSEKPK